MKLLAFGASSSTQSINKQLATYAVSLLDDVDVDVDVEILDLNDYEMPLYSSDREAESGIPAQAQSFYNKIGESDVLVISLAEHNGSYTAAYKNLFDWCSRISQKVFQGKKMVYLATSPGPGGAGSVLAAANGSAQYFDGNVTAALSIPSFYDNFDVESQTMKNGELNAQLTVAVQSLI